MKQTTGFLLACMLLWALSGCASAQHPSIGRVYSFSGESDALRVINGVAIIGGENEAFYGGALEVKKDDLPSVVQYSMKFYIADGSDTKTILSMDSVDRTGNALELQNQEIGQITGPVFNKRMDENAWQQHLYFQLDLTDASGAAQTYTIPMQVKEITAGGPAQGRGIHADEAGGPHLG